jgi:hypothetical protein
MNRIDRSVAAIIKEFAAVDLAVELVEDLSQSNGPLDPRQGRVNGSRFALVIEKPPGPHEEVRLMKVYVGGTFWFAGRWWRDGREKVTEKMMA